MDMDIEAAMRLLESADPLPDQRLDEIIRSCVKGIESLGPDFKIDWSRCEIKKEMFNGTNILGMTTLNGSYADGFRQEVSINRHLAKVGLEDMIENVVLHELCHVLQNQEAIAAGFYYISEGGSAAMRADPKMAEYFNGSDQGHSECWLKYVRKVNSELAPAVPVEAHPTDANFGRFKAANDGEWVIKIVCDSCHEETEFYQLVPTELPSALLASLMMAQDFGIPNDYCKCGGSIRIVFHNPEDKEALMLKIMLSLSTGKNLLRAA
jgi:hypothetical protein